MKKIVKDALILFIITLVAGILLGFVYKITKEPIAKQNEKAKIAAYNSVFSELSEYTSVDKLDLLNQAAKDAGYDAVTIDEAVIAYDSAKNVLGTIITVTDSEGYAGDIQLTVGIAKDGTITGIEFLDINETAGLGMKAKEPAFKNQFAGIKANSIKYTKSGKSSPDEIDAISSATYTTRAVTNGVNGALAAFSQLGGELSNE